jgi:hypothetical protein
MQAIVVKQLISPTGVHAVWGLQIALRNANLTGIS